MVLLLMEEGSVRQAAADDSGLALWGGGEAVAADVMIMMMSNSEISPGFSRGQIVLDTVVCICSYHVTDALVGSQRSNQIW